MPEPVIEQNPTVAEGTVMLSLTVGQVTNRKKVDTSSVQSDIDEEMLHVGVDLYKASELKDCQTFLSRMKLRIKSYSVPSFFRGGIYLVKHEAFQSVDEYLQGAVVEFAPLVDAFAAVSEERKEESRARLGSAFDPSDYPTPEQIKKLFKIEWRWFTMSTPDDLAKLNKDIYEREVAKAAASASNAAASIEAMLAAEARDLCNHMASMLAPEDGKQRIFKINSTNQMKKFLDTFNWRNVGSTEDLNKAVEQMRILLDGVDPSLVRESKSLREDLGAGFRKVQESLQAIVTEKPKRFIDLSEVPK